ncbi:ceramide transfer protein-like [Halyomorpha halys]|uniref:ceramide transfer protein-like n=1 Tax=Halyomorpha halys TaxID=286706 RepID=UPI0006D4E84B
METYRDILCSQMDTLQRYFDSCADYDLKKQNLDDEVENINGKVAAVDFKGEAMTFKATSGAVLTGLAQCIEAITKREEMWKRKLEKEHQRLLRLEETCLLLRDRKSTKVGPDQEVSVLEVVIN